MRRLAFLATLVVSVSSAVLAACGADPVVSGGSGGKTDKVPAGSSSSSTGGFDNSTPTNTPASDCAENAKLVYVISEENDLYSFAPDKLTFTKIGALNCAVTGRSTPNSMAVDRAGNAWVNYDDDAIFKVSTTNAACEATTFQAKQGGLSTYGMAFATTGANETKDALYVVRSDARDNGRGLFKLDLATFALTPIGDFSGSLNGIGAELTGTGDGRLFGFFSTSPDATLAQIDEGAGATSNTKALKNVSADVDFAFSFWGGDFWFYTSDGEEPSTVTQLKASGDGSLSVAMKDVGGFKIVGAGVSTCAPTAPPPR